jgi:uncharacterized protein
VRALLFLAVILAGVWWWRSRQASRDKDMPETPPAQPLAQPLDMVRCTQCGMHIPGVEAVQGKQGPYCSQEHLKQLEP